MGRIYTEIKGVSKNEMIEIALPYCIDENGVKDFIEKNWDLNKGYVAGVVSVAIMLNDKEKFNLHDLHMIDFLYGRMNGVDIRDVLNDLFNIGAYRTNGIDIVEAYNSELGIYREIKDIDLTIADKKMGMTQEDILRGTKSKKYREIKRLEGRKKLIEKESGSVEEDIESEM